MNREQQKQLKELRKEFPKICRELASRHKLKCKDYSLFAVKRDLFFDTVIYVSVNDNDECICSTRERVKPMWMDEMLWDLLEMPENKKAPVSLRAYEKISGKARIGLHENSVDVFHLCNHMVHIDNSFIRASS